MKALKAILFTLIMIASASTVPASAQFKFGPKVGLTVNDIKFNEDVLKGENQAGWTAGLMAEFTVPIIGIGADLSAMYVRRNSEFMQANNITKNNRDYIEIPLNVKYKFTLPAVGQLVAPYIGVGPSVSFLTSKKAIQEAYYNKSVDWALNFGIGVQLFSHLDVNARYGLGLTKAVQTLKPELVGIPTGIPAGIEGKNRYWTITVGYLF